MTDQPRWALSLLGRPKLTDGKGREASLPRKAFVMALRLIIESPTMRLDRDAVASFLWPHNALDSRQGNLRALIKRVRSAQANAGVHPLLIEGQYLRFDAYAVDCDVYEAMRAIKSEDAQALARLAPALTRPLLEGCDDDAPEGWLWLKECRANLLADYKSFARRVLTTEVQAGQVDAKDRLAKSLIGLDATDEAAYRALMRRAAASGDLTEARAVYDQLSQALRRECARGPSDETRQLRDSIVAPSTSMPKLAPPMVLVSRKLPPLLLAPTQLIVDGSADAREYRTLVDDLAALLWKARTVRVAMSDQAPTGADLTQTYRLTVSLRRTGRCIVTTRLGYEATGEIVWTDSHAIAHEIYDDVLIRIAAPLLTRLERHQVELCDTAVEGDLSSFVLIAKANRDLASGDLPSLRRARRRFRQAMQTDKKSARACAGAARTFWLEWVLRAGPDPALLDVAEDLARKAVAIDPDSYLGHRELGMIASYRRRPDAALKNLRCAVRLSPETAMLRLDFADALVSFGAHEEALREIAAAERGGGPLDDISAWIVGTGLYMIGDYRQALGKVAEMNNSDLAWRVRVMCHGMLGEREQARQVVAKAKEFHPDFNMESWMKISPISQKIDRDHVLEGMRRAGLK